MQEEFQSQKFGKIYRKTERHVYADLEEVTYEYFRLLSQDGLQKFYYKFPKDWKESIKEKFLPKFILNIFPVKYTEINISIDAIFPELHKKIKINEPVVFIVNKEITDNENRNP